MYLRHVGTIAQLLLACQCLAGPVRWEYPAVDDDAVAVGSLRREVRELPRAALVTEVEDATGQEDSPKKSTDRKKHRKNSSGKSHEGGYYKTYGSDADGEKGYLKKTYSKGDHGYKTLDTFHKQDGDKYGFEEHTAYGKARDAKEGDNRGKSGSYSGNDDDHEGAGTIVDTHYVDSDGEHVDEGESSRYTHGGDGDHYSGDYGGHYTSGDQGSGSYRQGSGDGHSENYSTGGGDEGSYGSHSSYSTSSGDGDDEGGHY